VGTATVSYVIPFEGTDNIITELTLEDVITEDGIDIVSESAYSGTAYVITIIYNGNTYSSGNVFSSGSFTFPKDVVNVTEAVVSVSTSNTSADTIEVTVGCPVATYLTIYNIAITSNNEAGEFIHNEYRWTDGTFTSPLHSNLVTFASGTSQPLVSQYITVIGAQGSGIMPANGALVTLFSNKKSTDNFVFNPSLNKFKYLRTNTVYQNNSSDINSLLAAATTITPIVTSAAPDIYSANFTMPNSGNNLYMIWDYREPTSEVLCYSTLNNQDACCGCVPTPPTPPTPVPSAPTPVPSAPTPSGLYYTYNSCDPSYAAVSVFLSTPPSQTADRRYRISTNSYFVYDGNPGTTTPFNPVDTLQFTGQVGCI